MNNIINVATIKTYYLPVNNARIQKRDQNQLLNEAISERGDQRRYIS